MKPAEITFLFILIQNGYHFAQKVAYSYGMVLNVIFVAYGYEMGEFECDKNDLWDSKMAIGSHFVQSCNWSEMIIIFLMW